MLLDSLFSYTNFQKPPFKNPRSATDLTPMLGKALKQFGYKLWTVIEPEYISNSSATKGLPHNMDKVTGCCVMAHGDDVWTICEAVYNDKIGLATIATQINSNPLEGAGRLCLACNWLSGIKWKVILTMFA